MCEPRVRELAHAQSRDEFNAGTLIGPFSSLDEVASHLRCSVAELIVSPRFCVEQCHFNADGSLRYKIRVIDDLTFSGLNATAWLSETYVPAPPATFVAQHRILRKILGPERLAMWGTDFTAAYRNLAVLPEHLPLCVIVLVNNDGSLSYGILSALPFGARAAPVNWARLMALCAFIHESLAFALLLHCVDDVNAIEPYHAAGSGLAAWEAFVHLAGLKLNADKKSLGLDGIVQGIYFDVRSESELLFGVAPSRKMKICNLLESALETRACSCLEAKSMFGKLSHAAGSLFQKVGRAQLHAVKVRAYYCKRGTTALTPDLEVALRWWITVLRGPLSQPRPAALASRPWAIVFTDAVGESSNAPCFCAGLVWTETTGPGVTRTALPMVGCERLRCVSLATFGLSASEPLPTSVSINVAETLAVLITLETFPEVLAGHVVTFYIDSQAAMGALMNGTSDSELVRFAAARFWLRCAELEIFAWFEWVPSHSIPFESVRVHTIKMEGLSGTARGLPALPHQGVAWLYMPWLYKKSTG